MFEASEIHFQAQCLLHSQNKLDHLEAVQVRYLAQWRCPGEMLGWVAQQDDFGSYKCKQLICCYRSLLTIMLKNQGGSA